MKHGRIGIQVLGRSLVFKDLSLGTGQRIGQIVAIIYFLSPTKGDGFFLHPCFFRHFILSTSLRMT